jgi:hypothetical protein
MTDTALLELFKQWKADLNRPHARLRRMRTTLATIILALSVSPASAATVVTPTAACPSEADLFEVITQGAQSLQTIPDLVRHYDCKLFGAGNTVRNQMGLNVVCHRR